MKSKRSRVGGAARRVSRRMSKHCVTTVPKRRKSRSRSARKAPSKRRKSRRSKRTTSKRRKTRSRRSRKAPSRRRKSRRGATKHCVVETVVHKPRRRKSRRSRR